MRPTMGTWNEQSRTLEKIGYSAGEISQLRRAYGRLIPEAFIERQRRQLGDLPRTTP